MRGSQGPLPSLKVLGEVEDGGTGGRVLRSTLPQRERGHPGRPTVAHHFQCGDGRSGLSLGIPGGVTGRGRYQWGRKRRGTDGREDDPGPRRRPTTGRGKTPEDDSEGGIIIFRRWNGRFHRPGMTSVGIRHTDRDVLPGGTVDEHLQDRGDGVTALPGGQGAGR